MREDVRVVSEAGHHLMLAAHLGSRGRTRFLRGPLAAGDPDAPLLTLALKRLASGELLAIVSNRPGPGALKAYRRRWAIECVRPARSNRRQCCSNHWRNHWRPLEASLGDAKTRGLNIEDTRLTCPRKLDLLMGLAALAIAWAARSAIALLWPHAPRRAGHGHLRKSWFRTGFDDLRRLLQTDPLRAVAEWQRLGSKRLQPPGVV